MTSFVKISLEQQIVQPWKNGRGQTRQIAISPAGSDFNKGEFDWRVSTAQLTESGPFSSFSEFERHLVLLEGSELELSLKLTQARSFSLFPTLDVAVQFSGNLDVNAILRRGPVRDLNIFCRKDRCQARVQITRMVDHALKKSIKPSSPSWLLLAADDLIQLHIKSERAESEWLLECGEAILAENWDARASGSVSGSVSGSGSCDSRIVLIEILPL